MSLKEFEVDDTAVDEGLPWGGLTLSHVMQQKGGSFFSVIEYVPYERKNSAPKLELPEFRRGWAVWNERQHTPETDRDFIVLFWNPFETKAEPFIENALGEKISKGGELKYFGEVAEKFCRELSKNTAAKLLTYQELLDFLAFTLTLDAKAVAMPEVPLYLDALLSQDVRFKFQANDIFINDNRVFVATLPTVLSPWRLFDRIKNFRYRYVRRMLIFSKPEAELDLKKYDRKWCPRRKVMLEEIESGVLLAFNGYYYSGIIFQLDEAEYAAARSILEEYLTAEGAPFIFEQFNLKDVWWGSLPGVFLANITPPVTGFDSFEEFILSLDASEESRQEQKFQRILDEIESERGGGNVPH